MSLSITGIDRHWDIWRGGVRRRLGWGMLRSRLVARRGFHWNRSRWRLNVLTLRITGGLQWHLAGSRLTRSSCRRRVVNRGIVHAGGWGHLIPIGTWRRVHSVGRGCRISRWIRCYWRLRRVWGGSCGIRSSTGCGIGSSSRVGSSSRIGRGCFVSGVVHGHRGSGRWAQHSALSVAVLVRLPHTVEYSKATTGTTTATHKKGEQSFSDCC